ncbi:Seipin [Frankliniella fusca]|uniref:Seipin n=1 Tax=Frankliniella fusca TaxID=407009 RepID=A0AAE1LKK8_9NEOP|nr:Seipin [Frankliniella fusca]
MFWIISRICRSLPFVGSLRKNVAQFRQRAEDNVQKGVENVRLLSFRGGLVGLLTAMIIWVSIFLYIAFYYAYMPSISHIRPIHVQFEACKDGKGLCSFPTADVRLTKRHQLLMVGQPYKIFIQLEMPESPRNKDLGMFMVCASLRVRSGVEVNKACRSAMLHYRSPLLETLTTITLSPLMVLGQTEEKQSVMVELFSDFEEDQDQPVTDVKVEIQTRFVELYSATMLIHAHLTGLRYLMFHWPILSAAVGISSNLFFILLMFSLSWWHLSNTDDSDSEDMAYENIKDQSKEKLGFEFIGELEEKDSDGILEDVNLGEELSKQENASEPLESSMFGKSKLDLEENVLDFGVQEVPK